jgi:hypothetical protein
MNQRGNTEKSSSSEYPPFFRKAKLAELECFQLMLDKPTASFTAEGNMGVAVCLLAMCRRIFMPFEVDVFPFGIWLPNVLR